MSAPLTGVAGRPSTQLLGEQLLSEGLASQAEIDSALDEQRLSGGRIGEILLSRGIIDELDLARALAHVCGMEFVDLLTHLPDPGVVRRFPLAFCRRRGVIPIADMGGHLVVGMANPADLETLDDVRNLSELPVQPVGVAPRQLQHALEDAFRLDPFSVEAGPGTEAPAPAAEGPISLDAAVHAQAPVVQFVNQLLIQAVDDRCSDVHFEPSDEGLRIRYRIDGILGDAGHAPPALRAGIISRLKVMGGMDITEHRRPQDGRMSLNAHGREIDIRLSSLPTVHGESIVLRLFDKDLGLLSIQNLGFRPGPFARYEQAFRKPWGLLLVSGPTGSGKSTTLYATVSVLNDQTRNTVTVEDPVEYQLRGIKQTQVNPRTGYDFAEGLRAALRSDPDVILIGEIRDLDTARTASEAAMTGHLVLSTIHANDAASSMVRLIDMGLEPYRVISSLECVVAQRLLRRLCNRCKAPYEPSPSELHELAASGLVGAEGVTLHRATGCEACNRTGYFGRLAVHEVLVMTRELESMVLDRRPPNEIAERAVASGMETLRQDAFAKVLSADTSLEEVFRIVV